MPIELIIAVGGSFLTIALITGFVAEALLSHRTAARRRLRTLPGSNAPIFEQAPQRLVDEPNPLLTRMTKLLPKSAKQMTALELRLAQAGHPGRNAAIYFALAELFLPVVVGLLVLFVVGGANWPFAALAGCAGVYLPRFYMRRQTKARRKAINNGLPDALDLVTLCVEAGAGLDQAIAIASDELSVSHPALASELRMMTTEIRVGRARLEAFANLADRTSVEDVKTLTAVLAQTERFGTSVGQALRTHSATARMKRRQVAQERAAKLGVKMVFPLVLCLFPALYVVAFGPVIIRVFNELLKQ